MRRSALLLATLLASPACSDDGPGDDDTATDGGSPTAEDDGATDDGQDAATYPNCDTTGACPDAQICVPYTNGDDMPAGIQWCGEPCDPAGDASACPPPHPNAMVTPTCVELADGTGACGLDCEGGYNCPPGMSCFDGRLCVWGDRSASHQGTHASVPVPVPAPLKAPSPPPPPPPAPPHAQHRQPAPAHDAHTAAKTE